MTRSHLQGTAIHTFGILGNDKKVDEARKARRARAFIETQQKTRQVKSIRSREK
jgi:hypothetical protein